MSDSNDVEIDSYGVNCNVTRRRFIKGTTALLLLSVSPLSLAAVAQIVAVRVWPSTSYTRITIESHTPLEYRQFFLDSPKRLVIDIVNTSLNKLLSDASELVNADDPYLSKIRVGQFDEKTVRLVLELKQDINPELFSLAPVAKFQDRLVINLYPYSDYLSTADDPILALLQEYNKNDLNLETDSQSSATDKNGRIKDSQINNNQSNAPKKPDTTVTPATKPTSTKPAEKPKVKTKTNRPFVVMIDPGHGGEDPGAIGKKRTQEKNVVLSIAHRLRKLIDKAPNMKAYMTRRDDVFIPLAFRVTKARSLKADIFISIHADAFSNASANGSSVYALSRKGATSSAASFLAQTQNESDKIGGVIKSGDRYLDHTIYDLVQTTTLSDSLLLGNEVLKRIGRVNRLHKSKVEQAGFIVLQAPDVPSILIETAFISNLNEEIKLKTAKFQQQLAESIFVGIKAFAANNTVKNRHSD